MQINPTTPTSAITINMKAFYGNIYANAIPAKTDYATTADYKLVVGYPY